MTTKSDVEYKDQFNALVAEARSYHPDWNDEELYDYAKGAMSDITT